MNGHHIDQQSMQHTWTHYTRSTPYHTHNVPHRACSQCQGTLAAAQTPPMARLASLLPNAAAVCRPAHTELKSDVSTSHRQTGWCSAAG